MKTNVFKRGLLLLFIVVFFSTLFFFNLYVDDDWWMFFCCFFAYSIQALCIICMIGYEKEVTITSENILCYKRQEDIFKTLYAVLCITTILLDAFPFIAMLETNLKWIIPWYYDNSIHWHGIPQYEGGFLVTILTFSMWYLLGYSLSTVYKKNVQKAFIYFVKAEESRKELIKLDEEILKLEEEQFRSELQTLTEKYGTYDSDICLNENKNDIKNHILVFEKCSSIFLQGEIIPFNKIIGFVLHDDPEIIQTSEAISYTSITKTSTGNMIGRALVGGALLGGVGAVIGASTAKKETSINPSTDDSTTTTITNHNFICYLNINDIVNPVREIYLGNNLRIAQVTKNLFNTILERNKSVNK